MQKIAAFSNLVSYYFIGLPVGAALMFQAELRVQGNAFTAFCHSIFLKKMKCDLKAAPLVKFSKTSPSSLWIMTQAHVQASALGTI